MNNLLEPYYSRLCSKPNLKMLSSLTQAMLSCSSSNTQNIAREMSCINKKSFNTNEKNLAAFLSNDTFKVQDSIPRCHINMVFDLLVEQKYIKKGGNIFIQVDTTSSKQDFLILCASMLLGRSAVPIYFSMRLFPVKSGTISTAKLETAFFNTLKHSLSKNFQYTIVADRGFGNSRIIDSCIKNNFNYVLRLDSNKTIDFTGNSKDLEYKKISDINRDGVYDLYVKPWKKDARIWTKEEKNSRWYLTSNLTNLSLKEITKHYEDRFKIEKVFKEFKSAGFDIENSKIKKYSRFKKLLFLCMIAHSLTIILGGFIEKHSPSLKKNFPMNFALIVAYLQLQKKQLDYIKQGL